MSKDEKRLRIAHVIPTLNFGGAESFLVDLANHLQAAFDVHVVALTDVVPLAKRLAAGVELHVLGSKMFALRDVLNVARTALRLRRYLQSRSIDIMHTHLFPADVVGRLAAPVSMPIVSTLHGPETWRTGTDFRSRRKTAIERISGQVRAVKFIAVSEATADIARQRLGVGKHSIRTIYNGIPLPSRVIVPGEKANAIIQVGRMYPEKGHQTSLRAFAILSEHVSGCRLVLVGDGPERASLERLARELGIGDRVNFLGAVDDVSSVLAQSDIFWMPSRFEGLSIACLEAMGHGLVVIGSNIPGLRATIADGLNGCLVPTGSATALAAVTQELLFDPERRRQLGTAARVTVVANFALADSASKYANAYYDVAGGRW